MILTVPGRDDIPALADLWHDAWHEAHAAHVPEALIAHRTRASFRKRLGRLLPLARYARDAEGPIGFCAIDIDPPGELDQLFVAKRARGTGVAARLLADGEARLAAAGCAEPVLKCLPENARALAFYRRQGWRETGVEMARVKTVESSFPLPCQVLRKTLSEPPIS